MLDSLPTESAGHPRDSTKPLVSINSIAEVRYKQCLTDKLLVNNRGPGVRLSTLAESDKDTLYEREQNVANVLDHSSRAESFVSGATRISRGLAPWVFTPGISSTWGFN